MKPGEVVEEYTKEIGISSNIRGDLAGIEMLCTMNRYSNRGEAIADI